MQCCTLYMFPCANASIHQVDEHCDWLQLTQILLFPVLYWRSVLCNAPFIVHLPWRQQLSVKYILQASWCEQSLFSYRPEMTISIQNSLQRPMNELVRPGGKHGVGVLWKRKHPGFQGSKRIFLSFIYKKKQGKSFSFLQIKLSHPLTLTV